jgi:hypothetical protein
MGEYVAEQRVGRRRAGSNRTGSQPAEAIGRRLLDIIVYAKGGRIGSRLSFDDLAEASEVGDWKMPDFKTACAYAAAQGWLTIDGDALTLTTAGLAAA